MPTTVTVSNGQTSTGLTVVSGETLTVNSGGKIVSTLVNSGGVVNVLSGGVDSSTTISAGGAETINSGGTATGDLILGTMTVISTGASGVSNETVASGGVLNISKSATVSNTILSGGTVNLLTQAGSLAGSLTMAAGTSNTILVSAVPTTVGATGDLAAIAGFTSGDKIDVVALTAAAVTMSQVISGANTVAEIISGGVIVDDFIFSGTAMSGNLALTADAGGHAQIVYVSSSAPVGSTTSVTTSTGSGAFTETSGNTLLVLSGGSVSAVTVNSGGALVINGGLDHAATVALGGVETVSAGSASGDVIAGGLTVSSGASTTGETVLSGGSLVVGGGGIEAGAIISAGGVETVGAGAASGDLIYGVLNTVSANAGVLTSETVEQGGVLILANGNTANTTTVLSGGVFNISGADLGASNTVLSGGGVINLLSPKAQINGAITFAGGGNTLEVSSVTSAGYGDLAVISGFSTTDRIDVAAIAAAGASLSVVASGGSEVATITNGAASQSFIFGGASTYTGFTLGLVADATGGAEIVYNPNAVALTVGSGVTSTGLNITSGETVTVLSGGVVSATHVQSGGALVISGADHAAIVAAGGIETILGSASGDQIAGAATVGGAASGETVLAGGSLVVNGGVNSAATVSAGGAETVAGSGTTSGDQIFGALGVAGGSVASETVHSGGALTVSAGLDTGSTILAGGNELVLASATGDQVYGTQLVSAATAVVTSETVYAGGAIDVFLKGGIASATIVSSGGTLNISGAAFASNTVLSGGGELNLQSPKAEATGALTFAGGGNTLEIATTTSAGFGDLAVMSGFSSTDKIDIAANAFVGSALTLSQSISGGNTVAQVISGGLAVETFIFAGGGLNGQLGLVSDGGGGVDLEIPPVSVTTSVTTTTVSGAFVENATDTLLVLSGGSVTAATIQGGGFLTINGGVDSGANILAGGLETVSAGSASGDQILGVETVSGGAATNETVLSGGELDIAGGAALGAVILSGGGLLDLTAPTATAAGTVTFTGGGNTLKVDAFAANGAGDQALLAGFSTADKIDLSGVAPSSASLSYGTNGAGQAVVTVTAATGAESFLFSDPSVFKSGAMSLISDGAGGSDLILDTTPVIAFTSPGGATNNASQLVHGTVNVAVDPEAIGETVSVSEGGAVVGAATVGADGYWSAKVGLLNANGDNSLSASVTDAAGNTGATSAAISYEVKSTAPAFAAGDLVLSVYGDGAGTGAYGLDQAAPITLEEVTTSGTFVGQLVLPETSSVVNGVTQNAISGEYGSASEGTLQLSADGHSLVIMGYGVNYQSFDASNAAAVYGTAALGQTTSIQGGAYTAVARIVADINADGVVDTSTALYNVFNSNNPRSAATVDGTSFYISGQGVKGSTTQGVFYAADGAASATSINKATDTRVIEIYNGQLYVSADSTQGATNIVDYGALSTLSPPSGQVTPSVLTGISNTVTLTATNGNSVNDANGAGAGTTVNLSPESFFFANATTLYVADSGLPKNGGLGDGGLQKWVYSGGQWNLEYTLSAGLSLVANSQASGTTGLIGLTGKVLSDGSVELYATNEAVGELGQTYLFSVTDQLNATASASGEAFSLLMTAPADQIIRGVAFAPTDSTPTITSQVGQTVNGGTIELKGTGVAGDTIALYADGGSTIVGTGLVASNGTFDITTSTSFADGIHTLAAAQTDANGVLSAESSSVWISVNPNAPTITGTAGQAVNGQTIELTGTGEAGETVALYVGSVNVGSGVVRSNGTFDISTNAEFVDGQYSITAVQSDADGLSSAASAGYLASVNPNAPAITALVGHPINGSSIEVTGSGEAGETITLYADGGATAVGSGVVAANGTFDITTSATFADGQHSLTATETNAAGLTSSISAGFGVAVNPSAPAISALVGHPINGSSIEVTGSGEAGETVTLYADGGVTAVGGGVVSANGTFDITTSATFADGQHSLTATETDAAGLTSSISAGFGVAVNPSAPAISALVGHPINGSNIEVTGSGEAGETVTLYADGGATAVGGGVVAADGTFDITTSATFADGQHSLTATETDTAGLTSSASAGFGVAVNPSAPAISALVGHPINGSSIEVTGSGEAGETVTLYADGGATAVGGGVVAANGTFDITTSATFADGQHSLTATETDAAGLSSKASAGFAVSVAPANPALTGLVGEPASPWTIEVQGVGQAGDKVTLLDGGVAIGTGVVGANGAFDIKTTTKISPAGAAKITATLAVSETDAAGISSAVSAGVPVTISGQGNYYLTPLAETITGQGGTAKVYVAAPADLNPADAIDLTGDTTTTLQLGAGGVFDLAALATLKNIGVIGVSAAATTIQATAAEATAKIVAGAGGTTLEITTGGAVALNAADLKVQVKLDQATDLTAPAGIKSVLGSAGNDTLELVAGNLVATGNYDGAGGANTLKLLGTGAFGLNKPATLANFQTVDITSGQSVTLRAGTSLNVNVQEAAGAGAIIIGANNADTINLGAGPDTITLGGVNEMVKGGSGAGVVVAKTAANAAALLTGGAGGLTLDLQVGGVQVLNAADSGVTTLNLNGPTAAYTVTTNNEAGLLIDDLSAAKSTVTLGGQGQTVTGGAGKLTVVDSRAGGDTLKDQASLLSGDVIHMFGSGGNRIDATDIGFSHLTATFTENAAATSGVLKLTDGTHTASVTLFGQWAAAGFNGSASAAGFVTSFDGAAGTSVTHLAIPVPT